MKHQLEKNVSESSDSNSSQEYPYIPSVNSKNLEVKDDVYEILEYVSLDWPSQTVAVIDDTAYVGTNPTSKEAPSLVKIDFSDTHNFAELKQIRFEKAEVSSNINRIRVNNFNIGAISDSEFKIFNSNGVEIVSKEGDFGYGLATIYQKFYVGRRNGELYIYDSKQEQTHNISIHSNSIESISLDCEVIFSGGCDHKVVAYDLRANELAFEYKNDCDVNSVDYRNIFLVFGDDNGLIKVIDTRKPEKIFESIDWHKSPISMVKWAGDSDFYTLSDEQVCLWDIELQEDWQYHKWLRFVHAGQKYYKDIDFMNGCCITTSQEGICLFKHRLDEYEGYES